MEHNLNATLMLSNQGPHPMLVQPTLFSLKGERLDIAPVTLEGNTVYAFNIQEWAALGGPQFWQGSLQVLYNGADMELGGVVRLVDADRSLSFDEELTEPAMMFASSRLEGVWWLPSRNSEIRLAISNTTDAPLSATLTVDGAIPRQRVPEPVTLLPHETRVMSVQEITGRRGGRLAEAGGISIEHSGQKGALLARAMVQDASTGYSSVIEFIDPQTIKKSKLDGTGLRTGKVAGEELTQVAVARNVGDTPTLLTGRLPYTTSDGSTGTLSLPEVRLAPGETKTIDLARAIRASGQRRIAAAGLEFKYRGAPGSVVMAAQSVSASGNQVFRVPLVDAASQMSSTGQYPWSIDDNASTYVYIKNVTGSPEQYTLQINYPGGVYSLGLKTIEAGQTMAFDLRKLRDRQIPDAQGRVLPVEATHGQVHWSIEGDENLMLIGRVEQVDTVRGMSMTSSCMECCPDSWYSFWMSPSSASGFPGDTTQFTSIQQNQTCYGEVLDPFTVPYPTWSSTDPSVASCDGTGLATAQLPGFTHIQSRWTVRFWDSDFDGLCHRYLEQALVDALCDVLETPASLRVLSVTLLPDGPAVNPGCPDGATGIKIGIRYEVLDRAGNVIMSNAMEPQEKVTNVSFNGTAQPDSVPDWDDIGPSPNNSETSRFTDENGQFYDAPYGFCWPTPFTEYEFKQPISILLRGRRYSVRTNNITVTGTSLEHGTITNGSDIQKNRP